MIGLQLICAILLLGSLAQSFQTHSVLLSARSSCRSRGCAIMGMPTEVEQKKGQEYSFVRDELRPYAMKLHTKDQAPREGQQKAQTPFTQWQPSRMNYLQFLVDSLKVYETLESLVLEHDSLASLRSTGLERSAALRADVAWMLEFDPTLGAAPATGKPGEEYAAFLQATYTESVPKFLCHYYNQYFAHTAGGLRIGQRMADMLLEGTALQFYKWEGDLPAMKADLSSRIDLLASSWSGEEKLQSCEETKNCFKYGGGLMSAMAPPKTCPM
jgi:hypothetical protein